MEIKLKFNSQNYKKQSKKFLALSNSIHLRILIILENGKLSHDEIHKILEKEGFYKHRENTYHALEKLLEAGFIIKEYQQIKKKFLYSLI
ncbi:hypothetical protein HOD29_07165 [archaeon]|nr:hypothetical protein [archaeon]